MSNTGTTKGFATAAGEGERIWFVADTLMLKATAASTGKSYTVVECLTAPGGGPPPPVPLGVLVPFLSDHEGWLSALTARTATTKPVQSLRDI